MFINYFKSSFFSQYLVIAITGMLLWLHSFITPPEMPLPDGPVPLYGLLHNSLNNYPLIAVMLGFMLVMTETYFIATIFSRHELVLKNSSLSALVFMVLMSYLPAYLTLNPVNISTGFVIIILHQILIYYNKPEHLDRVFVAGFFTSMASLIYLPFILWIIFVFISLIVCRAGNWRAWMAAFIGLLTPFIYLSVWVFWHNQFIETALDYILFFKQIHLFPLPFRTDFYVLGGFTLLLSFWGMLFYRKGTDKVVEIRSKSNVLLWTLFFVILSLIYSGTLTLYHILLAVPALTLVITRTLTGLKKPRLAEMALLLYFISVLLNNLLFNNLTSL